MGENNENTSAQMREVGGFEPAAAEAVVDHPLPKLQLRHLSKSFPGRVETEALKNVNLEVYPGEFICLLGMSGCGKSTLIDLIAGFTQPTSGEVLCDGESITTPSADRGVVFQKPSLMPWLSVTRNIGLGLRIRAGHEDRQKKLENSLKLMGLEEFARHRPRSLSGGMAQRVAIARALINDPAILLFDEPFSALDALTRTRLQTELIRLWTEKGFTAVFVTHDIEEAVYLGSRIVILSPRPGRLKRVFSNNLRHPRKRDSVEFLRLRMLVEHELTSSINDAELIESESIIKPSKES